MIKKYCILCWVLCVVTLFSEVNAQSLSCNDHINVSVNEQCSVDLTVDMLLEGNVDIGEDIDDDVYTYIIYDLAGDPLIYGNIAGATNILGILLDANLDFEVHHEGGNACWGTVIFEDKIAPTVECDCPVGGEDLDNDGIVDGYSENCTLTCWELPLLKEKYWDRLRDNLVPEMVDDFIDDNTSDNCDGVTEDDVSYYDVYVDLGSCNGALLRRTWTVNYNDGGNGSVSCTKEYFFKPVGLETVIEARVDQISGAFEIIEDTLLLPPSLVELSCGADLSPEGIAAYFDNPGTVDQDTNDDRVDPDELDIDFVVENNEGIAYAYPHYYIEGRNPSGPHAQAVNTEVCNFIVAYTDQEIDACAPGCDGNRKVLRTWTVLEWCSGNFVEHLQVIKSTDSGNPTIDVSDVTASVDPWKCTADVSLPHPEHLADDCDNNITYSIGAVSGGLQVSGDAVNGYILHDAPKDAAVSIEYLAEDCCGNIGRNTISVNVVDLTAPVPVTKEFIVLSLTNIGNPVDENQGIAKIFAADIDNGSYDGCTGVDFSIRRVGEYCTSEDTLWGESVKFCCEDLQGQTAIEINVEFRVSDAYGNANYAWSTIRLEDKSGTTQTCPEDMILSCDMDYNDFTMTGLPKAFAACGEIDLQCDQNELVEDTEPRRKGPNDGFFNDPRYDGVEVPAYDPSCGYGAIRRQFKSCSSCTQWFVIEPIDAFDASTITFPEDQTVDCDGFETGGPEWEPATCNLVGVSVVSDTFLFEDGACYKILNHWSVINWCTYDPSDPDAGGKYDHIQVIKIIDTQDPQLTVVDSLCFAVDADCSSAIIELSAMGNDEGLCGSDWLKWEVTIDIDSDWTSDYEYGTDMPRLVNGSPNPYHISPTGNNQEAVVTLPVGIASSNNWHRAVWRLYDGCGNNISSVRYFQVTDKKVPTPYCLNLSTAVMSATGEVELWAIDFNVGSFDNCSIDENLYFTFANVQPPARNDDEYNSSSDLMWYDGTFWYYDSSTGEYMDQDDYGDEVHRWEPGLRSAGKVFSMDDADATGIAQVPVYVWDENGNSDFCLVNLRLIDNQGVGEGRIAGQVLTEKGEAVEGVTAELIGDSPEYPIFSTTDQFGEYAFDHISHLQDYQVSAFKADGVLDGVSTLDLLLIQKHILGQQTIDSPYKLIAADINNDKEITAIDLIELRKIILGVNSVFPANTSWKMVNAFQDLSVDNVWSFKEELEISDLSENLFNENFIGVKIGDVNGSIEFGANGKPESQESLIMTFEDRNLKAGDIFELALQSNNDELYGLQFTMNIEGLELSDVFGNEMNNSNIGVFENKLTVSYHTLEPIMDQNDVMTFVFKAKKNGLLSDLLNINSSVTKAEAYLGKDLKVFNIGLDNQSEKRVFKLYQNQPNPFNEYTVIGFDMPEAGVATLTLFNVTGQLLRTIKVEAVNGYNEVKIYNSDIETDGLIYYRLESKEYTASKHMIFIK